MSMRGNELRSMWVCVCLVATASASVSACSSGAGTSHTPGPNATNPSLGPNSTLFDPGPNPSVNGPVTIVGTLAFGPGSCARLTTTTDGAVAHTGDTVYVAGRRTTNHGACGTIFAVNNIVSVRK